jgi:hypothetical protein
VSGKPFQSSLMFVGEARSLPYSGASERCFTWIQNGLAYHYNVQFTHNLFKKQLFLHLSRKGICNKGNSGIPTHSRRKRKYVI